MFRFFLIFIGIAAVMALFNFGDSEQNAELVKYAAERNNAQDQLLVELAGINDPAVSEFVRDWRKVFPQPTPEQLSELRIINQNIKNDKSVAIKYTIGWKEENSFCGQLKATFGSNPRCSPGL